MSRSGDRRRGRRPERARRVGVRHRPDPGRDDLLSAVVGQRPLAGLPLRHRSRTLDHAPRRLRARETRRRRRQLRLVTSRGAGGDPDDVEPRPRRHRRTHGPTDHERHHRRDNERGVVTRRFPARSERAHRRHLPRRAPRLRPRRARLVVRVTRRVRTRGRAPRSGQCGRTALLRPHRELATGRRGARRVGRATRQQRAPRRCSLVAGTGRRRRADDARRHGRATRLGALVARRQEPRDHHRRRPRAARQRPAPDGVHRRGGLPHLDPEHRGGAGPTVVARRERHRLHADQQGGSVATGKHSTGCELAEPFCGARALEPVGRERADGRASTTSPPALVHRHSPTRTTSWSYTIARSSRSTWPTHRSFVSRTSPRTRRPISTGRRRIRCPTTIRTKASSPGPAVGAHGSRSRRDEPSDTNASARPVGPVGFRQVVGDDGAVVVVDGMLVEVTGATVVVETVGASWAACCADGEAQPSRRSSSTRREASSRVTIASSSTNHRPT